MVSEPGPSGTGHRNAIRTWAEWDRTHGCYQNLAQQLSCLSSALLGPPSLKFPIISFLLTASVENTAFGAKRSDFSFEVVADC